MSTFSGKIDEIEEISIDRYTGENLNSVVYFLSHCHTDHMSGLGSTEFKKCLFDRKDIYVYSSPVTIKILEGMHSDLKSRLRVLDFTEENHIEIPETNDFISVTLIPAGHCPGSVMFLFQYKTKHILYTGDFRINPSDLYKIKAFKDETNQMKHIDNIYLDTTFFIKSHPNFPKRNEIVDEICALIKSQANNPVQLNTSAWYGYEDLFIEVSKRCKTPIHVNRKTYNLYKFIPELDNCVTLDANKTFIHSNCDKFNSVCVKDKTVCTIVLTAFYWRNFQPGDPIIKKNTVIRACYSTHASCNEIIAFLDILKPKQITPCVLQRTAFENIEMHKLIKECEKKYNDQCDSDDNFEWLQDSAQDESVVESNASEDEFAWLDSPTPVKKMRKSSESDT